MNKITVHTAYKPRTFTAEELAAAADAESVFGEEGEAVLQLFRIITAADRLIKSFIDKEPFINTWLEWWGYNTERSKGE